MLLLNAATGSTHSLNTDSYSLLIIASHFITTVSSRHEDEDGRKMKIKYFKSIFSLLFCFFHTFFLFFEGNNFHAKYVNEIVDSKETKWRLYFISFFSKCNNLIFILVIIIIIPTFIFISILSFHIGHKNWNKNLLSFALFLGIQ